VHGGGLAHAVAAEQRDHFALADLELDAEQDLAAPVRGLQAAYLEHQPGSPRYARRTSSFPRISSGVPVAMTRP
jgi:hypothetical protein